jgi:hypothetical protein
MADICLSVALEFVSYSSEATSFNVNNSSAEIEFFKKLFERPALNLRENLSSCDNFGGTLLRLALCVEPLLVGSVAPDFREGRGAKRAVYCEIGRLLWIDSNRDWGPEDCANWSDPF